MKNKDNYEIYTNNRDTVVAIVRGRLGRYYRGVAKCNSHDTFDFDKGVEIALNKAFILLNKDKINEARGTISSMNQCIRSCAEKVRVQSSKIEKWQEEIQQMKTFNKSC